MSQNYVIGPLGPVGSRNGAAIVLPNRQHPAFTVFNTGPTTVYLDDEDPAGAVAQGLPLTTGSSIPWDENRALYATCPTTGTLTTTGNTGIPFDAGALASAIVDQGLAGDIAAAIYLNGAPPVDKFTQLYDSGTISGASTTTPQLDTSSYASLFLNISNGFPTRMTPGHFTISWYSAGASPQFPTVKLIATDEFYLGSGVTTEVRAPVRGALAVINVAGGTGSCSFQVYGSYKAIDRLTYLGEGSSSLQGGVDGTGHLGVQTWNGNIPIATSWAWQPDVGAGPCRLAIRYTTASAVTMLLRVPTALLPLTTYASESNHATVGGQTDEYNLILPPMPVELTLQNTHASASLNFRATLTPEVPYH